MIPKNIPGLTGTGLGLFLFLTILSATSSQAGTGASARLAEGLLSSSTPGLSKSLNDSLMERARDLFCAFRAGDSRTMEANFRNPSRRDQIREKVEVLNSSVDRFLIRSTRESKILTPPAGRGTRLGSSGWTKTSTTVTTDMDFDFSTGFVETRTLSVLDNVVMPANTGRRPITRNDLKVFFPQLFARPLRAEPITLLGRTMICQVFELDGKSLWICPQVPLGGCLMEQTSDYTLNLVSCSPELPGANLTENEKTENSPAGTTGEVQEKAQKGDSADQK